MNEKLTLEDFGAKVRWKYPAYAKYSNREIGEKVLQKYPQYADNISDLPQQEKKGVLRRVGDLFTSGTQQLGATVGQLTASGSVIGNLSQSEQFASNAQLELTKRIQENKKLGRDTGELERALSRSQGRSDISSQIAQASPAVYKTGRQVVGEAIQTGVEALSGGVVSGISRVAPTAATQALSKSQFLAQPLKSRLTQIGVRSLKNAAQLAPFGYAVDVAAKLQEDKSGASVFTPGLGTAISVAIPLSIGGVQATRQVASEALSKVIAPNLSGVPSGVYKQAKAGGVTKLLGKITPEQSLDDARASASAFKSAMQKQFGTGREEIINQFTGKRIGVNETVAKKLTKIAERFGFEDRLPQSLQDMSAKETMDLLAEINSVGPITQIDDPLVRSFKLNLGEIKDEIVKYAVREFGGEGGRFQTIYNDYTTKMSKLKDIQSIIGKVGLSPTSQKLTPVQHQTATRRLQKIFNDDAEGYLKAIQVLEEETGAKILDKVAASQLSRIIPKSFRVNVSSIPGMGVAQRGLLGLLDDVISAVTFPLSSPRMSQWVIRKVGGYDSSIISRLLNASPSVRTAIYNAVHKENMAFSDAVELYAKDYLKNPRMGLSMEDVTKNNKSGIPQTTATNISKTQGKATSPKTISASASNIKGSIPQDTSLIQEARKYKSAEEFVKAQQGMKTEKGVLYHGSPNKFEKFDLTKNRQPNHEDGAGFSFTEDASLARKYALDDDQASRWRREIGSEELRNDGYVYAVKPNGKILGDTVSANDIKKIDAYARRNLYEEEIQSWKEKVATIKEEGGDGYELFNALYSHFGDSTKDILSDLGYVGIRSSPEEIRIFNPKNITIANSQKVLSKSQLIDIWEKANASVAKPYIETGNLTTKILKDLEGKTNVSKQYILDATNRADIKQAERDLIREVLKGEGNVVNATNFANKVKTELLPLKVRDTYNNKIANRHGISEEGDKIALFENVSLPDELRGPIANYSERIYESPIKTSAGDVHFSSLSGNKNKVSNYFAHTRIEDLPDIEHTIPRVGKNTVKKITDKLGNTKYEMYTDGKLVGTTGRQAEAQGHEFANTVVDPQLTEKTRRVIELQSDLFQKGRLESEARLKRSAVAPKKGEVITSGSDSKYRFIQDLGNNQWEVEYLKKDGTPLGGKNIVDPRDFDIAKESPDIAKLEPYRNTWHERVIREEVKQAAKDGKTKLQFPTGETAMKIEGLGDESPFGQGWYIDRNAPKTHKELGIDPDHIKPLDLQKIEDRGTSLKIGDNVRPGGSDSSWIITDVLGDGKFMAVPKSIHDKFAGKTTKFGGLELKKNVDIERAKETFDISGKVDTNNPIYRFYEKEVGRYLKNKYNAELITDPQGVKWWEVKIKPEYKKLPIEAFGVIPFMEEDTEQDKKPNTQ